MTIYDVIHHGAETVDDATVRATAYAIQFAQPWDTELTAAGLTRAQFDEGRRVLRQRLAAIESTGTQASPVIVVDDEQPGSAPVRCPRCGEEHANMWDDDSCWECGAPLAGAGS